MSARVLLGDVVVGELRPDTAADETTFEFDASYAASALRWCEPLEPTLEVASLSPADTSQVLDELEAFVRDARDAWPEIATAAPAVVRDRVTAHLAASSLR